ncbi:MAG: 50S ribosomal protein L21 [Oligoflexia bacterium]|nr:50S ribosomal protein L21 [Oligoflexia bacterium]
MYAVFHTGGKQYKVKKGDTLQVELLPLEMGSKTDFKEILLVGTGATVKIGQPFVSSATVSAEVVAIEKGPKVIVYHKKRRKQSDKKTGHRQPYTRLLITSIDNGAGETDTLSDSERTQVLANTGFAKKDAWALVEESATEEKTEKKVAKKKVAPVKKAAPAKKKAPAKRAAAKKPAAKKVSKKS